MIHAEAHTDDWAIQAKFDCEPWFKYAPDEAILKLEACGWGGDYPADEVAIHMADTDVKLGKMFEYLEIIATAGEKACGFECHVDMLTALAWLRENRPRLAERINRLATGRWETK